MKWCYDIPIIEGHAKEINVSNLAQFANGEIMGLPGSSPRVKLTDTH